MSVDLALMRRVMTTFPVLSYSMMTDNTSLCPRGELLMATILITVRRIKRRSGHNTLLSTIVQYGIYLHPLHTLHRITPPILDSNNKYAQELHHL
jgi:hypothetical protein